MILRIRVVSAGDPFLATIGMSALLRNGDGTLQGAITVPETAAVEGLSVADLDGDNDFDLVAGHYPNSMSVWPGNGDGTFSPTIAYLMGAGQVSIAIADADNMECSGSRMHGKAIQWIGKLEKIIRSV